MNRLKLVPPPPADEANWKRLMNLLYGLEEDALFEWLREVRAVVERAEKERAA